jgi:hypothetical protein
VASIIARGLAKIDLEKASKQDVEMLKKLIVEFKDELDALGVKVDKIDERVAVLEKDLGGWAFSGALRFDANFGMDEQNNWYGDDMVHYGKNDFDLNQYELWITKVIDEKTKFFAQIEDDSDSGVRRLNGSVPLVFEQYYVGTLLGNGWTFSAGRANTDWESELGLYNGSNSGLFTDFTGNSLALQKEWSKAHLHMYLGRGTDDAGLTVSAGDEIFALAARFNYFFNEKLTFGVSGIYWFGDDTVGADGVPDTNDGELDNTLLTVGAHVVFNFTPDIAFKGLYYYQDQGDAWAGANNTDDTASAWKVAFDIGQDALKFTSLWLEYTQIDNNFFHNERIGNAVAYAFNGASLLSNQPWNVNTTTSVYGAWADQQWSDKWRTFAGFYQADYDTANLGDASNWTLGVAYRYSPAMEFELSYDKIDYDDNNPAGYRSGDDNQIRFRTYVSF